jgi:hypothetical protein
LGPTEQTSAYDSPPDPSPKAKVNPVPPDQIVSVQRHTKLHFWLITDTLQARELGTDVSTGDQQDLKMNNVHLLIS